MFGEDTEFEMLTEVCLPSEVVLDGATDVEVLDETCLLSEGTKVLPDLDEACLAVLEGTNDAEVWPEAHLLSEIELEGATDVEVLSEVHVISELVVEGANKIADEVLSAFVLVEVEVGMGVASCTITPPP